MKRPNITPGQWISSEFGPISTAKGNIRYIANIQSHGDKGERTEEDMANAAAIAAVPDLLTALEMILSSETGRRDSIDVACVKASTLDNARAALTKAGYQF